MTALPNSSFTLTYVVSDTLTQAVGGLISVTSGDGLELEGVSKTYTLTVNGTIKSTADNYHAVLVGLSNFANITVATGGLLGENGILVQGLANITNRGTIQGIGNGNAIEYLSVADGNCTINNSGLIGGGTGGISFYSAGTHTITNSGTISTTGNRVSINSFDASAIELITNSGTITGQMTLGGGNDIVHTETGVINGYVNLEGGNDRYYGGTLKDQVLGLAGNDTIYGNGGADFIFGYDGIDYLAGGAAGDTIGGGPNNDTLLGGPGIDLMNGDGGSDILTGGTERDTFRYYFIADSGVTAATRDTIQDFKKAEHDRIDLSAIDAKTNTALNDAFTLMAAKGTATSAVGTGKIGWYWIDSANPANDYTILRINNDTDPQDDMTIALKGLFTTFSSANNVDFVF